MQKQNRVDLGAVFTLLICGGGLLLTLTSAVGLLVSGLLALVREGNQGAQSIFALAWTSALIAVLLAPGAVLALLRLSGNDLSGTRVGRFFTSSSRPSTFRIASLLMLAWPLVVLAGWLVSARTQLGWLLLPPLQIYAIGVPLWWFLELGRRRLGTLKRPEKATIPSEAITPVETPAPALAQPARPAAVLPVQRGWSILGFSMIVTPTLIMAIEIVVLLLAVGVVIVFLAIQPDMMNELNRLSTRILYSQADPEVLLRILRPILQQPAVIYGLLAMMAGVIPLIEELFKPLAVWGMVGSAFTPAAGFQAGLITGFAFGLLESLGMVSVPNAESWAFTVVGRFGTGLLHTLTSGLVGWGLASAWSQGKYTRLGLIYLVSASLHMIWNVFSLMLGLAPNLQGAPGQLVVVERLGLVAPFALVVLVAVMLLLLVGANRMLRREADID